MLQFLPSFQDIGAGRGKYYAVNFPMRDGIDDECYQNTFVPIMSKVSRFFLLENHVLTVYLSKNVHLLVFLSKH